MNIFVLMPYIIQPEQRRIAKEYGVVIVASKNKDKKLDVYKEGIKIASVGATGYGDFYIFSKLERLGKAPKGYAKERRRLYKLRHAKDRLVKFSNGWWADKLLW